MKNLAWGLCVVAMLASGVRAADYGTTGLIDIPTARMQSDGTLSVTAALDDRHESYALTYQVAPWLEGTFRYTGFRDFFYWDRNYELKARLLKEQGYLPQVAVGIRDLIGTGVFGSEYLVATKALGPWDLTAGIGWGRLAGDGLVSNPLGILSSAFKDRRLSALDEDFSETGALRPDFFFRGEDVGLFGGLSYRFSRWPLKALLEYNPDRYEFFNRRSGQPYRPSSPLSYGLQWQLGPNFELNLSHQHGDQLGVSFRTAVDTSLNPPRQRPPVALKASDLKVLGEDGGGRQRRWYRPLLVDVERSGLVLVSAKLSPDKKRAELLVGNTDYQLWSDALARHVALADLHLPASVRELELIVEEGGHQVATVVVPRPSAYENLAPGALARRARVLPGRPLKAPNQRTDFRTGKVNFTFDLNNRLQLFDPDSPARYQLYLDIGAELTLSTYWSLRANYALDLTNNFDESRRKNPPSALPKVRTDIVSYLTEGATGLDRLMLEGRGSLAPGVHYRAFAGVLEEMYSGLGGELLLWPHQSRLAFGASLSYVKQRDFSKNFGLRDYEVLTGFFSAYWASPFYNYDLAVHLGRYLAKDRGVTFDLRRTFANGWQVGFWSTFTNVSAEEFGEGSFDKGLYFKIPLGNVLGGGGRAAYTTRLRPVQRDGGQRLENHSGNLFWDLREARYDVFTEAGRRLIP